MPTVIYNPFVSKSGFKSEGFEVDAVGNLTSDTINSQEIFTNSIDASVIKLKGVTLFGDSDNPSLFEITGDLVVSEGSTPYLSVINGRVVIDSRADSTGKIDNVEIGITTPAAGKFTSVNTSILEEAVEIDIRIDGASIGKIDEDGIDIPVVDTTINNTVIGNIAPSSAVFTIASVNDQPLLPEHITRKDYVDNRISAFSIAFGI